MKKHLFLLIIPTLFLISCVNNGNTSSSNSTQNNSEYISEIESNNSLEESSDTISEVTSKDKESILISEENSIYSEDIFISEELITSEDQKSEDSSINNISKVEGVENDSYQWGNLT